jgi:2'-5' RNA ligase
MRIFIALQPTLMFQDTLASLQDQLRAAGVTGRYLTPSNLHMTLAFIGEWPEDVTENLPGVDRPFALKLSHIGFFPEAKVLWAGVEKSDALARLAGRVRHSLAEAGIPFDPKKFNPHITLVRKPSVPGGVIISEMEIPPAVMTVKEVCLYRSDRGKNGMVYTVIGSSQEGDKEREEERHEKEIIGI